MIKIFKYPANQIPVVPGLLTIISWVKDSVQMVCDRHINILTKNQAYKYSAERSLAYNDFDKIKM